MNKWDFVSSFHMAVALSQLCNNSLLDPCLAKVCCQEFVNSLVFYH